MSQTVLIMKDEVVLAASGREGRFPQLQKLEKEELTGFGEQMEKWKTGIRTLKERMNFTQVRLVLPTSVCTTKIIHLPYVGRKDLNGMAVREMQEAFRSDIMDYAVIRRDTQNGTLLSCASVEESALSRILEMCEELGIEVKSVTSPMEGLMRILPRLEGYTDSTAIYLFFEGGAVTSVLNETGHYKYSSRSRLFSEPGTLDFGTEIVRNVSGILQFHSASKSEHRITDVCYAGCPEDVFEVSREGLAGMNLEVQQMGAVQGVRMPGGQEVLDWLPCVGAMLNHVRGVHDMDLLVSYRNNSESEERRSIDWRHAVLPFTVFGLCAAAVLAVQVLNFRVQGTIDEMERWMEEPEVKRAYEEAQKLETTQKELLDNIRAVEENQENRETYPKLTDGVIQKISSAGGTGITSRISGYSVENGEMTFEAKSVVAIDIPMYIQRLTETGLFHSVEYTGYVFEKDAYTLSLLCTMKAKEDE